ncbi:DUF1622 domain-containing protein [Leptothermofonsia sp. ETS-13]|uniref:DUF1622 domain-containing protein n=1 Tax=Leptothermofonsia sp. ETS-13 TaxID=3035696 RepID=UPI003BA20827
MNLNLLAIALETSAQAPLSIVLLAENLLRHLAMLLKVVLESIAILIIVYAVVIVLRKLFRHRKTDRDQDVQLAIRLDLGLSLALSLEFLLAADIVGTAISPSWDAIGRLAAITGIRTFLNFFLQKEVNELEQKSTYNHHGGKTQQ